MGYYKRQNVESRDDYCFPVVLQFIADSCHTPAKYEYLRIWDFIYAFDEMEQRPTRHNCNAALIALYVWGSTNPYDEQSPIPHSTDGSNPYLTPIQRSVFFMCRNEIWRRIALLKLKGQYHDLP